MTGDELASSRAPCRSQGQDAQGWTAAWPAAGLPVETGMARLADEPDGVSLSAPERPAERERYMRECLAWEVGFVSQIGRDGDCRLRLAPLE